MILENINNNMDVLLETLRPAREVFGVSEEIHQENQDGLTGLDINKKNVYNVTKEELINNLDCNIQDEIQ